MIPETMLDQIRALSVPQRARLITLIVETLVEDKEPVLPKKRSILEFEGLGKEIWKGVDAQKYINELRSEWDDRA